MTLITDAALQQLPIHSRRQEIVAAVKTNQVTIITAETGAGKSTQVPQYLAEAGYAKIIVTQPRILAARTLSSRVRQEYSLRTGQDATALVGYRTASERDDNPQNVILYCTDGLQLVRELTGSGITNQHVLILDEVHEWNENMEVLVAWAKKRCQEEPNFKVVLMSATIEATKLATYFNAPAPISVAGKTYPVTKQHGQDLTATVLAELGKGPSNILVFLPGKAEIEQVANAIKLAAAPGMPIIALHSQLTPQAQQQAFAEYAEGKVILTTNIAQTSITIDGIDVVIDSGLERRSEVRNGVEGLFIAEVSGADCLQRAGRAGRTKPGRYILAPLGKLPCLPLAARPAYGIPEIMRKHIDRVVLRLAAIGIDIESLDFYHSPSKKTIRLAKRTLISLGALTKTGQITTIGQAMERFPVESSYARMLVEARHHPAALQAKLAGIIAIAEVGGIVKGSSRYTGWRQLTRQTNSDLLAHYEVYLALSNLATDTYEDLGIISRNVTKAGEVAERLVAALGLTATIFEPLEPPDITPLLTCIVAGQLHELYTLDQAGEAIHLSTKKKRELSSGSVVKQARLICGTPFDLQISTPKGLETLHLLNDVTAVDPGWLAHLAPNTFTATAGKIYFDAHYGSLAISFPLKFNGHIFRTSSAPLLEHTPANEAQFSSLYSKWLHERVTAERKVVEILTKHPVPEVPLLQIEQHVQAIAQHAVCLAELSGTQRLQLEALARLETHLGSQFRVEPKLTAEAALRNRRHRSPGRALKRSPSGKRGRKPGRGR